VKSSLGAALLSLYEPPAQRDYSAAAAVARNYRLDSVRASG
jgi:hypothetical protein